MTVIARITLVVLVFDALALATVELLYLPLRVGGVPVPITIALAGPSVNPEFWRIRAPLSSASQVAYCGAQSHSFLIWKLKFYYRTLIRLNTHTTK